jgi:tetratricopeptide (TPR) repeat protein
VYTFKHALTQDVTYGSLLQEQRRHWHRQVGEAVERLFADRTAEFAGVLARHFVESRDLARGLRYSLLAAEQASRVFAHDDALRHYERARVCAEAQNSRDHLVLIDEAVGDVNLLRGQLQPAIGSYERAVAQATTQARRAALKLKIGETYSASADPRGLPILMAAAVELDKETQPHELALATAYIGRYHHYAGRHAKAIEWLERARELAEPLGRPVTLWQIYGYLAGAQMLLGRYQQAMEWARRCLEMGERGDHPLAVALGYEWLAESLNGLGRSRSRSARGHTRYPNA